jgi:hypothetical protein
MSRAETTLRFPELDPIFFLSVSMDSLTDDQRALGNLLVTSDWHLKMTELNTDDTFLSMFTKITEDLPNFSDSNPEKSPINDTYFEKHPSISTEFSSSDGVHQDGFALESIILRVFEHGAITAQCRFTGQEDGDRSVVNAVDELGTLRGRARKQMYEAMTEFVTLVNGVYDDIEFSIPPGDRGVKDLERYEYIDTELVDPDSEDGININSIHREDGKIRQLRELVGFLRMSKAYSWPNFPPSFGRSYLEGELGNREDELWFVTSQRFIRYFPDKDISETGDFIDDVVLAIEILLSLRAVYKTLLEDVRKEIGDLPKSLLTDRRVNNEINTEDIDTDEIEEIQAQVSIVSFRLARTHFPSNVRFHAQSPFATKVFRQIETELQLPELAAALRTEMEKFQSAVDSFGTIITHRRNMQLQRRILILTVVVGLAGALMGLGNLITSLT